MDGELVEKLIVTSQIVQPLSRKDKHFHPPSCDFFMYVSERFLLNRLKTSMNYAFFCVNPF